MNGNSVICSGCNEAYDSYLEKCPKCGIPNGNLANSHTFNSSVLAPPSEVPVEMPKTFITEAPAGEQRISLTAIANDPKAVLDPNNMPMIGAPQNIPTTVEGANPSFIPNEAPEAEVQNLSLTEIANSYEPVNKDFLNPSEMPDLDVEVHVAKPDGVSLMDIANNYSAPKTNIFADNTPINDSTPVKDIIANDGIVNNEMPSGNPSLTSIANNYVPANNDIFKMNSAPVQAVTPQGQGNSSLMDIANNYTPLNNDVLKVNAANDVFNNPVNNNLVNTPADISNQIGVPPVSQSTVVTQEDLDHMDDDEFTPMQKLKYTLIILLILAGLNFIFLFMSEFNMVWFIVRIVDVVLTIIGYLFAMKNDKKAGIIGIICGVRLIVSIINFGIIDLLLGILAIMVSIEVLKEKK